MSSPADTSAAGDPLTPVQVQDLPRARDLPYFDPPPQWRTWQADGPLRRIDYGTGHEAWAVTDGDLIRQILIDPRFSVRPSLAHTPGVPPLRFPTRPGFFLRLDDPDHTRLRRAVQGEFTTRRVNDLAPRITAVVDEQLEVLAGHGPPADLMELFALPVPSLVVCEILGVPYADREEFQARSRRLLNLSLPEKERFGAVTEIGHYVHGLLPGKRAENAGAGSDDLLGRLAAADPDQRPSDEEIAGIGAMLLIAGHETTAAMIGLGTLALLDTPPLADQLRAAAAAGDTAGIDGIVDELLRFLTPVQSVTRVALEDVDLGGQRVRAGQLVDLGMALANRDPGRFADPDRVGTSGQSGGHLAFGHGPHACLGAQLTRIELRAALPALLTRFPALAVAGRVVPRPTWVFGVEHLPVAW